jgi:hypothetical protein
MASPSSLAQRGLPAASSKGDATLQWKQQNKKLLLYDLVPNQVFLPFFEVRWDWNHMGIN